MRLVRNGELKKKKLETSSAELKLVGKVSDELNLVEQEVGEEVVEGEVVGATGAVALVAKVGGDAHVAEAVSAGGQERVLHGLHAYRAKQVLVQLRQDTLRFFSRMSHSWERLPLHHRRYYRPCAR